MESLVPVKSVPPHLLVVPVCRAAAVAVVVGWPPAAAPPPAGRPWKADAEVMAGGLAVLLQLSALREGRLALTARACAPPCRVAILSPCCVRLHAVTGYGKKNALSSYQIRKVAQ